MSSATHLGYLRKYPHIHMELSQIQQNSNLSSGWHMDVHYSILLTVLYIFKFHNKTLENTSMRQALELERKQWSMYDRRYCFTVGGPNHTPLMGKLSLMGDRSKLSKVSLRIEIQFFSTVGYRIRNLDMQEHYWLLV